MTDIDPRSSRSGPRTALAVAGLVLASLLALALYSTATGGPSFRGTTYDPPMPAPDFALTDQNGRAVHLADFAGKPVLLFFGFVHCPDVCPLTLAKLSRVLEAVGADSSRISVLLITVDPERDTPEALGSYVSRFSAPITAATGDPEHLAEVRKRYGAYAVEQHGEHAPAIAHTARVFGIDRRGALRVLIAPEEPDETVEADVKALLRAR